MKVTEKESIIWASGHYLTNHLPNNYDEWEYIKNLAYDFELTVNKQKVLPDG